MHVTDVCVYVCVWLSAKMAHLLTCSVKIFGQTAAFCVVCVCTGMHVCVYVCVWLSAKMHIF